jgi:hypothetical protein
MSHLSRKLEPFSEQELKFFLELLLSESVAGEKKKFFLCKSKSQKTSTKTVPVFELDQSAHTVSKHTKKDPFLSTILKENLAS